MNERRVGAVASLHLGLRGRALGGGDEVLPYDKEGFRMVGKQGKECKEKPETQHVATTTISQKNMVFQVRNTIFH